MFLKLRRLFIVIIMLILGVSNPVFADTTVLQASGKSNPSPKALPVESMWNSIKAMEEDTGTIGTSDNLDCHMSKSSEYGAALLLTISDCGAGSTACYGTGLSNSSTNNASGIYQLSGNWWEWCAAYYTGGNPDTETTAITFMRSLDSKYVDKYNTTSIGTYIGYPLTQRIKGDALFASGFLGSAYDGLPVGTYPVLVRGNSSFGFFGFANSAGLNGRFGRAVVVCGS